MQIVIFLLLAHDSDETKLSVSGFDFLLLFFLSFVLSKSKGRKKSLISEQKAVCRSRLALPSTVVVVYRRNRTDGRTLSE